MNNVFLYAPRDSNSYRQVEEYLANLSFNGQVIVLPPGSRFSSPLCLHLRSNDIVILFAEDDNDFDDLLSLHDEFKNFRIIVVTKKLEQFESNKLNLFSPRFVACIDIGIENVAKYIVNLFGSA